MPDAIDIYGVVPQNTFGGSRKFLYEDFRRIPGINADITIAYNPDFELLGTGAVSADLSFNAGGGINLATHGGATDSAILLPHLDTKQTMWATANIWYPSASPQWGCRFKTDAALTNTTIWAGLKLTNTPVIATDDDQVVVRFQAGTDTYWQVTYSIAGTDTTTSCTNAPAVAAATEYKVWITIDASRIARVWINDVLVVTSTALTASAQLIPYVGVLSASTASAKKIILRDEFASIAVS